MEAVPRLARAASHRPQKSATRRPCKRGPKTALGLGTRIRERIGVGIGIGNCIGIGNGNRANTQLLRDARILGCKDFGCIDFGL